MFPTYHLLTTTVNSQWVLRNLRYYSYTVTDGKTRLSDPGVVTGEEGVGSKVRKTDDKPQTYMEKESTEPKPLQDGSKENT